MLVPPPALSSPARVVGLIARQHLHHHGSHFLVVGDIPEPVGTQDQNIIGAVLVLREVVNPDLASDGARREGEGQRRLPESPGERWHCPEPLRGAHQGSGHPHRLWPSQEPLGAERPAAGLTSGKQDRKGLMWMLELNTLRSWSPRPRVTPIVAITRAWGMTKAKENFKPLHLHSQLRTGGTGGATARAKTGWKPPIQHGQAGSDPRTAPATALHLFAFPVDKWKLQVILFYLFVSPG